MAFQDMLAVSCPKFIGVEIVLLKNLSQQRGSNNYFLQADGNRVLAATSRPHNEFFRPYLFAPPHGIALVYNGYHVYYVKIENHELAFGWNDVIAEHNFSSKYTLLLGSMGHLMFDLFIFDEKATFFTSCLVTTFRQFGDEFRFMKKLSHGDLLALELHTSIKDFVNEIGLHRLWLTIGHSALEVEYVDGFLISVDWELKMHAMVFNELGSEKTYNWY
ncbi:hypothetical protein RHGRI_031007 [Rhododendron griersonianum]|uniref:Uncharacterized protein n=1 Tax=Rhododendron griersonianum TaxID=479676 RepID=A0AAV6I6Y1_9ERIC|nr:hypothetical protein RHGRI_031007 [Rhododendron griersonianum]